LVGGEWATMELCCVLVRFGLAWFGLGRGCSKWVEAESLLSERKGRRGEGGRREEGSRMLPMVGGRHSGRLIDFDARLAVVNQRRERKRDSRRGEKKKEAQGPRLVITAVVGTKWWWWW
jgi:hypothetical protein